MKKTFLPACALLLLLSACNKKNLGGPDYNGLSGYYKVAVQTNAANSAAKPYFTYTHIQDTVVLVNLDVAMAIIQVPVDTFGGYWRADTLLADEGTPDTLLSYHEPPVSNSHYNYTMRLKVNTRTGVLQYSYADERLGYYWKDDLAGTKIN